MPLRNKKNQQSNIKVFGNFRGGGLNLATSDFLLSEKDIKDGKNFIYERDSGRLRTLEKLDYVIDTPENITSLYSSLNYGLFIVCGKKLYRYDKNLNEAVYIGELNGSDTPVFCDWGEEKEKKMFIASGSVVQYYEKGQLHDQTPVPVDVNLPGGDKWNTANDVMVREGRLLVARTGKDRLVFSGVGDAENWQTEDDGEDVHTDADCQWLEVGYKEGGDIVRILPVNRDLVIFRSDGNLYRLFSSYPDWQVIKVNSQVDPVNRDSVVGVGNDIMFLDRDRGLRRLSAVAENDELAVTEKDGLRVNAWLAENFTADARMWSLPDRGEIWIKPNEGNVVLVYNSRYDGWSKLDIGTPIASVTELNGVIYVAVGKNVYKLTDKPVSLNVIVPGMEIEFPPYIASDRGMTDYQEINIQKDGTVTCQLEFNKEWKIENTDEKTLSYQIFVADVISPKLITTNGNVVLDNVKMTVAEVV